MSLPTGDKAVMELTIDNKLQAEKESYCDNLNKKIDRLIKKTKNVPSQPRHRSAAISVHCTKAVYRVKSAPEYGRVCRPKHIEQIQIDQ